MRIIGLDIHRAFAEAVAWGTAGSDGWVVSTCGAICWMPSPQSCRWMMSW